MTETHTTSATYDQIAADYAAQAGRNDALADRVGALLRGWLPAHACWMSAAGRRTTRLGCAS